MFKLNNINNKAVLNENDINKIILRLFNYVYEFEMRNIHKFKTNDIQ